MRLPCAHQIFVIEVKNELTGTDRTDDVCIHLAYRAAGHLKGKQITIQMPVVLTELLKDHRLSGRHGQALFAWLTLSVSHRFRLSRSEDNHDGTLYGDVIENVYTSGCRCQFDDALLVIGCRDVL